MYNILISICFALIILSIANIYKFRQEDKIFKNNLDNQNRKIIFINNQDMDISAECYKPASFFKMHNSGKDPCEKTQEFVYKSYSTTDDYYIKLKTRYLL